MTEQLSGESVGFTNHNSQDITILELPLIAGYFFCFLGKLLMQTLPILYFCKKKSILHFRCIEDFEEAFFLGGVEK